MTEPIWIAATDVLGLHDMQVSKVGGKTGIRDASGIKMSLRRPVQQYHSGGPQSNDIHQLAALYAAGFATSQFFVDANDRVAFACSLLFLELNGWRIDVDPTDAAVLMVMLAENKITKEAFGQWLRAHSTHLLVVSD